jgi:hypothetical protein
VIDVLRVHRNSIGGAIMISLRDNSGDNGTEDTRRIVIGDICACW